MTYSDKFGTFFGRINEAGNVDVLHVEDGSAARRLAVSVYPVGSDVSARYEHADGIELSRADAQKLGIEIYDGYGRDDAEALALRLSHEALRRATTGGRFGLQRPLSPHVQRYARWYVGRAGSPYSVVTDDSAGYPCLCGLGYSFRWRERGERGKLAPGRYQASTHRIEVGPAWAARIVASRLVERHIDGVRTLVRSRDVVRTDGACVYPAMTREGCCWVVEQGRRTYHALRPAGSTAIGAVREARIAWSAQDRQRSRDRVLERLLDTRADSIYVSLADSRAAGNCDAGTMSIARCVTHVVDILPELACASVAQVLAVQDDVRTRAVCRVAAARYSPSRRPARKAREL